MSVYSDTDNVPPWNNAFVFMILFSFKVLSALRYANAVLAMALCPSVRLSVCRSVCHKSVEWLTAKRSQHACSLWLSVYCIVPKFGNYWYLENVGTLVWNFVRNRTYAWTPLGRFVVDLLYNLFCLHHKSTTDWTTERRVLTAVSRADNDSLFITLTVVHHCS